jgi:hypothetical protein
MGVGLCLIGTYPSDPVGHSAADWLERVAAWIEGHEEEPLMMCQMGTTDNDEPVLFVRIHPCAEDVEFRTPEAGVCIVSAKTSTAGPGYHIFACDLLRDLGTHFQINWEEPDAEGETGDETGYFHGGDVEAVRREMLTWLGAISRIVLENCKEDDIGIRMVSMPLDCSYPDQCGILTPLGPRSAAWFERMIATPIEGTSFFPWWPEGAGAAFFLGRALCRMWQEIRWRMPIVEDEGELLMDVHLDLERAHHLDPKLAMPWREWAEIISYLTEYFGYAEFQHEEGFEEEVARRAAAVAVDVPLIGYRRGRAQVTLTGGWSIVIPGEMAEEWEENGETWSAWHGGRTVWFTCWSVQGENDEPLGARAILESRPPWPEEGEILEHADGDLVGRAVFLPYEEDGESMWNLKAYSAIDGAFALCNIFLQDPSDLPWAVNVWKSLRN